MPTTPASPTLDDVFSQGNEPADIIVDADVIEAVKENIQPLQKGRRATALSAIFSTPHAQRETILAKKRARFRLEVTQALENVDEYDVDEDPLDAYSRFVAWTLESYPQGQSAESGLLELLEEATRQLKDRMQYKQDHRYLKLWTLYAGYVEKPAVIYSYLLANEVGTNFAQLYEEYADVLERDGRRREADEMYRLGISRKVDSIDHLKKRYADFQRRMLAAPLPSRPSPRRSTGPPTVGRRTILGETASFSHPSVTRSSDILITPQPNARLQIFIDPTGEAAEIAEGNQFPDVGTRISRTKENRVEVKKMGDGPLPRCRINQRSVSAVGSRIVPFIDPPARGTFVPFCDEEDTGAMPPAFAPLIGPASTSRLDLPRHREPPATPRPAFAPYKDEGVDQTPSRPAIAKTPMSLAPRVKSREVTSESEALRKDPFKNYAVRPDMT